MLKFALSKEYEDTDALTKENALSSTVMKLMKYFTHLSGQMKIREIGIDFATGSLLVRKSVATPLDLKVVLWAPCPFKFVMPFYSLNRCT